MNLDLTPDQEALHDAVRRLARPFAEPPADSTANWLDGIALYRELESGGFLEVSQAPDFGPLGAALVLEVVGASPYSTPAAGAALIAPMTVEDKLEGPVVFARPGDRIVRHLPQARTLVLVTPEGLRGFDVRDLSVKPLDTPFADSYGLTPALDAGAGDLLRPRPAQDVLQWWRLAIAIEVFAAARSAVDLTIEHVKLRRQFDRPIGSFQAIQHRLAECEVLVNGVQALTRLAAATCEPRAIALAVSYAQSAVERIAYDTQQFHGAIGITKQSPLHFHVYRLRALEGILGGAAEQCAAAADVLWPRDKAAARSAA